LPEHPEHPAPGVGLPAAVAAFERKWIVDALERYRSLTRKEQAEKLQIAEATLYKKLKEYDIT
jgi:DNA-binding NtrC family response regulator